MKQTKPEDMFTDVDVILPFRAADERREKNADFIENHLREALPGANLLRQDDSDPDRFNRGRAVNAAVAVTDRPVLVIADGDVWLPKPALKEAVERVRRGVGSYVIPFAQIIWFHLSWSDKVLAGTAHVAQRPPVAEVLLEWGGTSTGICNVVSRANFEKFGGFDPRFLGWGFEDCAWDIVATTLGGKHVRLHHHGRHLFHEPCPSKQDEEQIRIGQELHRRYGAARGNIASCEALAAEVRLLRGELV